jgi:GDP-L-fucose synthase
MEHYDDDRHVNVGTGVDLPIKELAEKIRDVVHPTAKLTFDTSKPDGTPYKVLDVSKLTGTGWKASIDTGIRTTYAWFLDQLQHRAALRGY